MSLMSDANSVPLREPDLVQRFRPGVIGSLVLHVLAGIFVVYQLGAFQVQQPTIALPVDLVLLDNKTVAAQDEAGSPQTLRPLAQANRAPARPRAASAPVPPAPIVQPSIVNPPAPEPKE